MQGLGVPFKYCTTDGSPTSTSALVAGQAYAGLDVTMGPTVGSPTYADKRAYCDGFNSLVTNGGGTILTSTAGVNSGRIR